MLVLSRKQNEKILIGNNIRITVVGIRGSQVRLGIEAPDWVDIYREELCLPGHEAPGTPARPLRRGGVPQIFEVEVEVGTSGQGAPD